MRIGQWTKFIDMTADDREAEAILRTGDANKIAAMAQARGFDFTEQDVEDAKLKAGELKQSELENVSGGGWNRVKNIQ